MVKHTQTICRLLPTNCLSGFDHFMGLALEGSILHVGKLSKPFLYKLHFLAEVWQLKILIFLFLLICMISNQGEKITLYSSIHNTLYLEVHCPSVRPSIIVVSESGNDLVDFGKVAIGKLIFFREEGRGDLNKFLWIKQIISIILFLLRLLSFLVNPERFK